MIITVASYKGGVAKTTTAVHIAAYLQTQAPTLLLDGDDNRSAIKWQTKGTGFPFHVADEVEAARIARDRSFEHTVIDTGQRPRHVDLQALVKGCDFLVVPSPPNSLDIDGLILTLLALNELGVTHYKVLIAKVDSRNRDAEILRTELLDKKIPVFSEEIPLLRAFETATAEGKTVADLRDVYAKRCWAAYSAVGKEILEYGNAK